MCQYPYYLQLFYLVAPSCGHATERITVVSDLLFQEVRLCQYFQYFKMFRRVQASAGFASGTNEAGAQRKYVFERRGVRVPSNPLFFCHFLLIFFLNFFRQAPYL